MSTWKNITQIFVCVYDETHKFNKSNPPPYVYEDSVWKCFVYLQNALDNNFHHVKYHTYTKEWHVASTKHTKSRTEQIKNAQVNKP